MFYQASYFVPRSLSNAVTIGLSLLSQPQEDESRRTLAPNYMLLLSFGSEDQSKGIAQECYH